MEEKGKELIWTECRYEEKQVKKQLRSALAKIKKEIRQKFLYNFKNSEYQVLQLYGLYENAALYNQRKWCLLRTPNTKFKIVLLKNVSKIIEIPNIRRQI